MQKCKNCIYYNPDSKDWRIGRICSIGMYATKLAIWVKLDNPEDELTCPKYKWRWILFEEK